MSNKEYLDFFKELDRGSCEDISYLGRWRLSSYKGEHGLQSLLDNDPGTFWQSDGELPHYIEIQFSKLVQISRIGIYAAPLEDNSYAPQIIDIKAGFGKYGLAHVATHVMDDEKSGWISISVDRQGSTGDQPLQCMFLRVGVLLNKLNGKDTHIRGLRVLGPRSQIKVERRFERI